ncbi:MAG: glycosyltransferase [gamma proteobacterium symbiont of Taylorina sp.]|nr:glycosyltransferase [gamma proteobacterium symbiont of Taylorina sp.]
MCSSLLQVLPVSKKDKHGWPWTIETKKSIYKNNLEFHWPKVSIITPSFNQGDFLEETIRSVLLQNYPNLEYIIIDGGSSDQSVDIIKKYEKWLTYWVSEADRGQSHAINKGMKMARGEVVGWLNSDDMFPQNSIYSLISLRENNKLSIAWVGECHFINKDGKFLFSQKPKIGDSAEFSDWGIDTCIAQPATLFSKQAFEKTGGLDEQFNYVLDVDLWIKLSAIGSFSVTNKVTGMFRLYEGIKSLDDPAKREIEHIVTCWINNQKLIAQKRLDHWGEIQIRNYILDLSFRNFILYVSIWIYRKTAKPFVSALKNYFVTKPK